MRWTADMIDATPHWCLRCERKIRDITVSRWQAQGWYLIRCPACGFILAKVAIENPKTSKPQKLLAPPPSKDDEGHYNET